MNTAAFILVIILSVFLAIFLGLAIFVLVKIVQILKHVKSITEKADAIADKANNIGAFFEKTAGPIAISRLISNILHAMKDHKKGKD